MTNDEIRELIRILQDTGIAELEVQRGDDRVWICGSRAGVSEVAIPTTIPANVSPAAQGALMHSESVASGQATIAAQPSGALNAGEANDQAVNSPIVGTYYDAPSPSAPPFVKVGDRVEPKQVLCIIESMKLMNEIEAEIGGTLTAKLVDNGRPVEYGETLFTIRPQ